MCNCAQAIQVDVVYLCGHAEQVPSPGPHDVEGELKAEFEANDNFPIEVEAYCFDCAQMFAAKYLAMEAKAKAVGV